MDVGRRCFSTLAGLRRVIAYPVERRDQRVHVRFEPTDGIPDSVWMSQVEPTAS